VVTFDALHGVIPEVQRQGACALVNKALYHHAAIRLLAGRGHADDAMALGRVMLGGGCNAKWIALECDKRGATNGVRRHMTERSRML
jgi:hypothetical protein